MICVWCICIEYPLLRRVQQTFSLCCIKNIIFVSLSAVYFSTTGLYCGLQSSSRSIHNVYVLCIDGRWMWMNLNRIHCDFDWQRLECRRSTLNLKNAILAAAIFSHSFVHKSQGTGMSSPCISPYGHQWNRDWIFQSLFSSMTSPPKAMVNIENPTIAKDSDFVIIFILHFCLYSFSVFDFIALFVNVFGAQIMAEDIAHHRDRRHLCCIRDEAMWADFGANTLIRSKFFFFHEIDLRSFWISDHGFCDRVFWWMCLSVATGTKS